MFQRAQICLKDDSSEHRVWRHSKDSCYKLHRPKPRSIFRGLDQGGSRIVSKMRQQQCLFLAVWLSGSVQLEQSSSVLVHSGFFFLSPSSYKDRWSSQLHANEMQKSVGGDTVISNETWQGVRVMCHAHGCRQAINAIQDGRDRHRLHCGKN